MIDLPSNSLEITASNTRQTKDSFETSPPICEEAMKDKILQKSPAMEM
jgi:hypothetical protein